jgi:hypothetical protein
MADKEMTSLPPGFALSRHRGLQGLRIAMTIEGYV